MRKTKKLHSISEAISDVQVSQKKNESTFTCIHIHQNWSQIVGSPWSQMCKPVGYNYPYLIVEVPSSAHRHEIQFQKESLVQKINKSVGFNFVKDIRFQSRS